MRGRPLARFFMVELVWLTNGGTMEIISHVRVAVFFCMAVLSVAVYAGISDASWAGMTMDELVDGSDIVIVGEVVDVRPAPAAEGAGIDIGTLSVKELLSGGLAGADVKVLFPSERARVKTSVDISYKVGQSGVWFLRKKPVAKGQAATFYLADHPQRLMGMEQLETVRGFIKARRLER